eukprot:m.270846 g.270846  ORF g.270846 m.270846 type:complete len:376 (+) comp17669_c0_seq8:1126-2253(+)
MRCRCTQPFRRGENADIYYFTGAKMAFPTPSALNLTVIAALIQMTSCDPTQLFAGGYPRGLKCDTLLICHEHKVNGKPGIEVQALNSTGGWQLRSVPRTIQPTGNNQLANCHMGMTADGHVMLSYRHHDGCDPKCTVFRIEAQLSHDCGRSWQAPFEVTQGTAPVWEPFVTTLAATNKTYVAYSKGLSVEPANTTDHVQSIVWRQWQGNQQFSEEYTIAYDYASRDGMVGIAPLPNGSLIEVFEGFYEQWGFYGVGYRIGDPTGMHWSNRQVAYKPADSWANAPQVVVVGDTIVLSCMSKGFNVDNESAVVLFSPVKNIHFANIKAIASLAQWPSLFLYKGQAHMVYAHDGDVWMDVIEPPDILLNPLVAVSQSS